MCKSNIKNPYRGVTGEPKKNSSPVKELRDQSAIVVTDPATLDLSPTPPKLSLAHSCNDPRRNSGSNVNHSFAVCVMCQQEKKKSAYSPSQWRKRMKGANWPKCKVCKSHTTKSNSGCAEDDDIDGADSDAILVPSSVSDDGVDNEKGLFVHQRFQFF